MIFNTGFTKAEIDALTYQEVFEYAERYYQLQGEKIFEFMRYFCIFNAESTAVAFNAKAGTLKKYTSEVTRRRFDPEDKQDVDEMFKEMNSG